MLLVLERLLPDLLLGGELLADILRFMSES
jgi:hypothetical protein